MTKKRLAIILGIRPDVIRASLILNSIRATKEFDIKFIWSSGTGHRPVALPA